MLAAALPVLRAASAAQAATEVDLQLVIAVDISASMDAEEFAIQRAGYVAALRHPDFIRAATAGVNGRIALAYFEWAGDVFRPSEIGWRLIDGTASAFAFADALEGRKQVTFRGTSIAAAIRHGAGMVAASPYRAWRSVIDISGDGPNNSGPPVAPARDAAVAAGITVNGLPILIRPSATYGPLDRYYGVCVTGGPGAFVLPVSAAGEFATAIRRKLIMEVSGYGGPPAVTRAAAAAETPVDCLIGETMRRIYSDPYFPELDR